MTSEEMLQRIESFLHDIGIPTLQDTLEETTFLPGIEIRQGRLHIDPGRLEHPGDILHEAGHVAVTEGDKRHLLTGNVEPGNPSSSLEPAAILWSYAALRHLDLPADVVFHHEGYKGQSSWMIEQFESGVYIGLPLLQWMGMAVDEDNATLLQAKPFPNMLKWLRG